MLRHRMFVTGERMMNVIVKSLLESFHGIAQNFKIGLCLFFFCHVSNFFNGFLYLVHVLTSGKLISYKV